MRLWRLRERLWERLSRRLVRSFRQGVGRGLERAVEKRLDQLSTSSQVKVIYRLLSSLTDIASSQDSLPLVRVQAQMYSPCSPSTARGRQIYILNTLFEEIKKYWRRHFTTHELRKTSKWISFTGDMSALVPGSRILCF